VALPVAEHRILPAGPFVRVAACSSCIAAAETAAVAACAAAMPGDPGLILDLPCLPLYVADDVVAEVAGVDVAGHVAAVVPSVAGEPSVVAAAAAAAAAAVPSTAVAPFAAVAVAVAAAAAAAAAAGPAAVGVLAALLRCRPLILASCLNLGE